MDYMKLSKQLYDNKYAGGYGINFPESHVIRIFNYVDRLYVVKDKKIKILDFGCGTGAHSILFESYGWESFGVDVNAYAIEVCKKVLTPENFTVILPGQSIHGLFVDKFDVIFANQSLYYLNHEAFNNLMEDMNKILTPDGIVVFTMMGSENYYFNKVDKEAPIQDGLRKVILGGRLEDETYINFVQDEKDLVDRFSKFEKILTGYYDFYMEEGSSLHYYFIGKKIEK